jgi:hypothetical protein
VQVVGGSNPLAPTNKINDLPHLKVMVKDEVVESLYHLVKKYELMDLIFGDFSGARCSE